MDVTASLILVMVSRGNQFADPRILGWPLPAEQANGLLVMPRIH